MDFFRGFYTAGGPDVVEGGRVASWRVDVDACPPGAVATRGMAAPVAGRDGRVLESKDSSAVLGERGNRRGGEDAAGVEFFPMTNPKDEFPRRTENKRDRGAIENAEMRVICVGMLRQRDGLGKIDFLSCGRSLATRKDFW